MENIALLFSGQGAQYAGMAKELYDNSLIVKETFEEASQAIDVDLRKLCFEGNLEELSNTKNTQPLLVTVGVAYFRNYMKRIGIEPKYLAGHSIGELTALTCSGAINFQDAVKIARKRGMFMQLAVPLGKGTMVAITGIDRYEIEEMCMRLSHEDQIVSISNCNSRDQVVVSGIKEKVMLLKDKADKLGAKTIELKVSVPFHSKLMQSAADSLKDELKKIKFNKLKYDVISNVYGIPYQDENKIIHNMSMQMVSPVEWQITMDYLRRHAINVTLELGPGKVLRNLSRRNIPEVMSYSYDILEDREQLNEMMVNNKENIDFFSNCLKVCVSTKNNNWNDEEYEKGVIENYNKIKEIEANCKSCSNNMKEALELVHSILKAKRLPIEEQIKNIQNIINETNTEKIFHKFISENIN
jgi:[acyl-carrier-protein] S-malonyltransferase